MFNRIFEAFNRPALQQTAIDEIIIGACTIALIFVFCCMYVGIQMYREWLKGK